MSDSLRPMVCSPPDSSVHGILQTRILEWVTMPYSRESSQPRDRTHISDISYRQVLYPLSESSFFSFFFFFFFNYSS